MKMLPLSVGARKEHGKRAVHQLRKAGYVPAVLYGHKQAPESLKVRASDLAAFVKAGGRLVELGLAEAQRKEGAFVKAVQHDIFTEDIIHVDFERVAMDEELTLPIPLKFKGTAAGVLSGGGVLEQHVTTVDVRCLPAHVPDRVTVDISKMQIGDKIHLKEIELPANVKWDSPADLILVSLHKPQELEVAPVAAEIGPAEPEVITAKKPEEGEEGEAPAGGKAPAAAKGAAPAAGADKKAGGEKKPGKEDKK